MRKLSVVLASAAALSLPVVGGVSMALANNGSVPSDGAGTERPVASGGGSRTAADAGSSTCTAENVEADLQAQPGGGPAMLILTNTGTQSCDMQGWSGIRLLAADNSPVPVPTENVSEPGPGPDITLEPGNSAFAGVKLTPCDRADADCAVSTTVEVAPPGDDNTVVADVLSSNGGGERVEELPVASVQVGTMQPITDGVVAW